MRQEIGFGAGWPANGARRRLFATLWPRITGASLTHHCGKSGTKQAVLFPHSRENNMHDHPRTIIARVVASPDVAEHILAVQALDAAFAWCAAAVTPLALSERVDVLRSLRGLNQALKRGGEYLNVLPELIERSGASHIQEMLKQNQYVL